MSKLLADRLKQLRIDKNVTQKEIGEYCHVATSTIQRVEYGALKPNIETLIKLADYFEVSTDYLLCRTEDPHGSKYT